MEFTKSNDKVLEYATYALDVGATRLVWSVEKPLRLFFCLLSFFHSFFGHFFRGITFTLVRKFQVEFMAALYLASNMHEPPFKPVPSLPPVPVPVPFACATISNFRCCEWAINLCILLELLRHRVASFAFAACPCHVLNLKIVSIGERLSYIRRVSSMSRGFALAAFAFALGFNNR